MKSYLPILFVCCLVGCVHTKKDAPPNKPSAAAVVAKIVETGNHVENAKANVGKGIAAVKDGKPEAAVAPLEVADAELGRAGGALAEASEEAVSLQKQVDTALKVGEDKASKLQAEVAKLKDDQTRKMQSGARWLAGICFLAGLGFAAAGMFAGIRDTYRIAAVFMAAAAICAFTAAYLNLILIITGVCLLAAACAAVGWFVFKKKGKLE